MDRTTAEIVDFTASLSFADLPAEVVKAADLRYADSIACALGARGEAPVQIAIRTAERYRPAARGIAPISFSAAHAIAPEIAAFTNTTMIRYLDLNDWAPNGHPSDCLGAFLSLDRPEIAGPDLVVAAVVSYQVLMAFNAAAHLQHRGWDEGFAVGVATVAGLGALLRLDSSTIGDAIGIIASSGVPVAATRSGELTMWKASATGYATRNAVFATLLAAEGMKGPAAAFDGRRGIKEVVSGDFELSLHTNRFRLMDTALKYWPVCYHAQAPAWAAYELQRDWSIGVADIESVVVSTYQEAWRSTGSEPEKWRPESRETADHSTPWTVARMLIDGTIGTESFHSGKISDPAVTELMSRITVESDQRASHAFPDRVIASVTVTDRSGRHHRAESVNPAGHPDNPMSAETFADKFGSLAGRAGLAPEQSAAAFRTWSQLHRQPSSAAALAGVVLD